MVSSMFGCLSQAAAQPAHTAAPAPKSKGRGSKSKAAQQAATSGADAAAAAAAAAAEAMLEDSNKLKLAGLLAVMGKLASAEPFVSPCTMWFVAFGHAAVAQVEKLSCVFCL